MLLLTWLGWQISEGMVSGWGASDKRQTPGAEGSSIFYLAQRERERGYHNPNRYRYPWVLNSFSMSNFKDDEKTTLV